MVAGGGDEARGQQRDESGEHARGVLRHADTRVAGGGGEQPGEHGARGRVGQGQGGHGQGHGDDDEDGNSGLEHEERGNRDDRRGDSAPEDDLRGSVLRSQGTAPEEGEDFDGGRDHAAEQEERIVVAEDVDAVPDAEGGDEVEAADAEESRGHADDDLLPRVTEGRADGALLDLAGLFELTEDRGLLEAGAQVDGDDEQRQSDEERDPPAE